MALFPHVFESLHQFNWRHIPFSADSVPLQHTSSKSTSVEGATDQQQRLSHGSYDKWRSHVVATFNRSGLSSDTESTEALERCISKVVLDRIPDEHKQDTSSLWAVLPRYSASFKFMGLPTEIWSIIFSFMDLDYRVDIRAEGPKLALLHKTFPPIAHTSSSIRHEVLPAIYRRFEFCCSVCNPEALHGFTLRPEVEKNIEYISRLTVWLENKDKTILRLSLGSRKHLTYSTQHGTKSDFYDPQFDGFRVLDGPLHHGGRRFESAFLQVISKYGLDEAEFGDRGARLVQLVPEIQPLCNILE